MPRRSVPVSAEMLRPDRSAPARERHADISPYFSAQNTVVTHLPLDQVRPNPYQPRKHFPPEELDELAQSMRELGFFGALLARPAPDESGAFELAYGERRWRAARLAGLAEVPVYVRGLEDREMLEIAMAENLLRADLNPLEEAQGLQEMIGAFGYSIREMASRLGKGKGYVEKRLFLLRAPADVQAMIREHPDTVHAARPLSAIDDAALRAQLMREVQAGRLGRDDIEDRATQLQEQAVAAPAGLEAAGPAAVDGSVPSMGPPEVSPAGDTRRDAAGALPPAMRRDRLSIGYRALASFFSARRVSYDADTASKVRAVRELCDRYLALWEARGEQ